MKKIMILLMTMFWCSVNAFSQSDCKKFRTGKFQNIENGAINCKIERSDSIQIELSGERIIKLRIEWIDECSYRLTFLEGNDAWWESRSRNRPMPVLIVKIIDIKANSYLQETKVVDGGEFKYTSIVEKIE